MALGADGCLCLVQLMGNLFLVLSLGLELGVWQLVLVIFVFTGVVLFSLHR